MLHRHCILALLASFVLPAFVYASPPKVAVDIAPLHSLVAQVMDGVGEPDLLIPSEASPHSYSLRPSEARALSRADVVFRVGDSLTPWLGKSVTSLAGSAVQVEMLEIDGAVLHDYREGTTFEHHDHHDDGHGADHHADSQAHEGHHERDPHAWLDPVNATVWLKAIAQVLAELDEANAGHYQRNAEAAIVRVNELTQSIQQQADELEAIRFIVFHDAYQYFERRFDLLAAGSISLGDASDPSPARVREIRNAVEAQGVTCVFTEPQYNPDMVNAVFENSEVKTIGVMDPLGADITAGKGHYPALLQALITSLQECLRS